MTQGLLRDRKREDKTLGGYAISIISKTGINPASLLLKIRRNFRPQANPDVRSRHEDNLDLINHLNEATK